MAITAAQLIALVTVRGAEEAALKLASVGGAADSAGAKFAMLATGGVVLAGAALIGVGVASTKMAADFQQGITRLVTGAGDVTDNMTKMGQGILAVSTATGVLTNGTDGLNAAMYQIISSGQRGAQSLDTLSAAAKGAQIEQAKVVDVANVLSGAMTNYGTKQFNATQFMNGFITAVQHGKITLQDLAVAMGPIDPIAQSLGIHFNDVAAAMTTQTNAMIPAARAATGLRFMMIALENPTDKAKGAMAALGLNSVKVGNEMKVSLPGALQMIVEAAKKVGPEGSVPFNRAVGDMVGGMRGLSAFLALTGPHMKDFSANSAMILAAMQHNKDAVIGWDTVQQNFNIQMDRAKAVIAALAINIGTALLPVLTGIVQHLIPVITHFSDWVTKSHAVENAIKFVQAALAAIAPYAQAFGQAFMSVMPRLVQVWQAFVDVVQRTSKWLQENKGFMEALKVTVIALGVAVGVILLASLGAVVVALASVGLAIVAVVAIVQAFIAVGRAAGDVWNRTVAFIVAQWNTLKNAAVDVWSRTSAFIVAQWNTLANAARDVWGRIGQAINTAVSTVVNAVKNAWNACVQAVVTAFKWMYDHNYYWKQMVDTAVGTVKAGVAIIQHVWNTGVKFIADRWNELASAARDVWNRTGQAIHAATNTVVNIIHTAWNAVVSFLSGIWNTIKNGVTTLWNNIVSIFTGATGRVMGPVDTLGSQLGGFFSGLASTAVSWGTNIIQGIVNGINGMLGNIASAAQNVAGTIAKFLGFHSPTEEGPGRELDNWGPAMSRGFAEGIVKGIPQVQAAVDLMMTPTAVLASPSFHASPQSSSMPSSSSGQPVQVTINLAGQRVAQVLLPEFVQAVRAHTGVRF